MGVIVEFKPREHKMKRFTEAERLKAMVQGKLEVYICGECHGEFEVINDVLPTVCPCCGKDLDYEDDE